MRFTPTPIAGVHILGVVPQTDERGSLVVSQGVRARLPDDGVRHQGAAPSESSLCAHPLTGFHRTDPLRGIECPLLVTLVSTRDEAWPPLTTAGTQP